MLCVFLMCLTIHEYVIKENYYEFSQVWTQHCVHQCHKRRRCIGYAKAHYQVFLVTKTSPKRGLGNILLPNTHLVVPRYKINLRKISRTLELIKQLIYARHWVLVLNHKLIKRPIVYTHPHRPIFLLYQKNGQRPW